MSMAVKRTGMVSTAIFAGFVLLAGSAAASDWEEETPKSKPVQTTTTTSTDDDSPREPVSGSPKMAPLQGYIKDGGHKQQPGYIPGDAQKDNQQGPLDGKAIDDELRGMIKDGSLQPLQGLTADPNKPPVLNGMASKSGQPGMDPDEDDRELQVEWDRWRNRFLRAVQLGLQESLNNPDPDEYERPRVDPVTGRLMPRFPLGTGAVFSCQITNTGEVKNLDIIESSGFPKYDRALVRAIRQLEGTKILVYPRASRRTTVTQMGRIKTATTSDFQYHHFGDVEKVRQ